MRKYTADEIVFDWILTGTLPTDLGTERCGDFVVELEHRPKSTPPGLHNELKKRAGSLLPA